LKHTHTKNWRESNGSYLAAKREGWFDELSSHMIKSFIPHDSWTKESCIAEAKKYKTKLEFSTNCNSAYKTSKKNGWFYECCEHMEVLTIKTAHWTKKQCIEEAKKYDMKDRWKKGHNGSYKLAHKNGWVGECSNHMIEGCKPPNYWTKERCMAKSKKYRVKEHWKKGHPKTYQAALRNGWYDELTLHMVETSKPNGYWNKERCIESAKHFKSVSEWSKSISTPAQNARRNGWMDECTAHMVETSKPAGYWSNKTRCITEAKKAKNISEWAKNSSASYTSARKNGWMDECRIIILGEQ